VFWRGRLRLALGWYGWLPSRGSSDSTFVGAIPVFIKTGGIGETGAFRSVNSKLGDSRSIKSKARRAPAAPSPRPRTELQSKTSSRHSPSRGCHVGQRRDLVPLSSTIHHLVLTISQTPHGMYRGAAGGRGRQRAIQVELFPVLHMICSLQDFLRLCDSNRN
jgi:hypothetical protein